jgi:hypothetical protein
MGLWGVLIDVLKTAASHAAPHVARTAVDLARERIAANGTSRGSGAAARAEDFAQELSAALASFDQRLIDAEKRATGAEQQLTMFQERVARQWARARLWVLGLLAWNAVLTAVLLYFLVTRR